MNAARGDLFDVGVSVREWAPSMLMCPFIMKNEHAAGSALFASPSLHKKTPQEAFFSPSCFHVGVLGPLVAGFQSAVSVVGQSSWWKQKQRASG